MNKSLIHVIDHPLVQHKLSLLRDKTASLGKVRSLVKELSLLLGYEITRQMPMIEKTIETPITSMQTKVLAPKKMALVAIMRAGHAVVDGLTELLPTAHVGHIGLFREHKTDSVIEYFLKLPSDIHLRQVIVVDCLLAGGHSAAIAVSRILQTGCKDVSFLCLLASKPGLELFHHHHPDIPVYTAAIDPELNARGFLVPGVGDMSDRIFGTQ